MISDSTRPRNQSMNSREASDVINFLGGESSQTRSFYKNVVSSNLDDEIKSLTQHLKDLNTQKHYKLNRQSKLTEEKSVNIIHRFRSESEKLSSLYIALTDRLSQLDYINQLNDLYLENIFHPQENKRVYMNQDYTRQMNQRKNKFIKDKVDYFFTYLRSSEKKLVPSSSESDSSSSEIEEEDEEGNKLAVEVIERKRRKSILKKKYKRKKRMKKRKQLKFEEWNEQTHDFSSIPVKKERGRLKARVRNFFQPAHDEFVSRKLRYRKHHDKSVKSQIDTMVIGERIMLEQHFAKEFLKDFRKRVHLLEFVNDLLGMSRNELDRLLTQSKETEFKTEIGIFDTEMIELRKEYQFLYWKYLRKMEKFQSMRQECKNMLLEESQKVEEVKKRVFEDVRGRYNYLDEKEREAREKVEARESEYEELMRQIQGVKDKIERNKKEVTSMKSINKELEEGKKEFEEELELQKSKLNLLTKENDLVNARKDIVDRELELKNYNNRLLGKLIYLCDLKHVYTRSISLYYHQEPYVYTKNEKYFKKKIETLNESLSQSITNSISSLSFFRAIHHINRRIDDINNDELRNKQKTKYVSTQKKKFYKTLRKTIDFNKHEKTKIKEIVRSTSQINWFLFSIMEVMDHPSENYKNDRDIDELIDTLEKENNKKAFNIQRLISYHMNENYVSSLTASIIGNLKKDSKSFYESPFEHVVKKRFLVEDDILINPKKQIKRIQKFDKLRRSLVLDNRVMSQRERKRKNIVKRVEKTLQDFLTKQEY